MLQIPSPALTADMLSEFKAVLTLLESLDDDLSKVKTSRDSISYRELFAGECDFPKSGTLAAKIAQEQQRLKSRDKGIELRGGLSTGSLSSRDGDGSGHQDSQGYFELSWDVLKNGFLANKYGGESLALESALLSLKAGRDELQNQYTCNYYKIANKFSGLRIRMLEQKLRLMETIYKIERRAYFKQWSYLDDYLVSEQGLVMTRHELDSLYADPYFDTADPLQSIPSIISVNLAELLNAVRNDSSLDALYDMEKSRLRKEADSIFNDRLRVYLRNEMFDDGDFRIRDDFVAGLRFRVPIYKRDTSLLSLQLAKLEQKKKSIQWKRIALCRGYYRDLQEQLRRSVRQHYRSARAKERVRQTLAALYRGDQTLVTTAITRMNTLIDSRLELIDAEEELFRRVIRLFRAAQVPYDEDFIHSVTLQPDIQRARAGIRSVYIWSDDFNRYANADIIDFLEAKQITRVLLSGSGKLFPEKKEKFLSHLSKEGVQVELIVGDNTWFFRSKQSAAIEKTLVRAEETGSIHYDIEPQALDGYRENKTDYIQLFIALVQKSKKHLLDRGLAISVPFHWPAYAYEELAKSADRLHIMAYGTDRSATLLRRIQPALEAAGPDKLAIALRPKDFKDEWAMEQLIQSVAIATGIQHFSFHDLGQFITLAAFSDETQN
ncbi:TolC family protein [Desulfobacter sp.]